MPLLCHCVDIRRFDFRGDYSTDKQLKRTIESLVGDTLVAAAAEDVTERILHEALLKAKGGLYARRFTMTSKQPPQTNSDDEAVTDNGAATVPQGDTPLSPEVIKMVSTLSAKIEENPANCTEKESLEEEIKKMISKISAFEFETSSGKTVTEGQGDAEVVEAAPESGGEIGESQAAPDLLLERTSSEEWGFQESKEDIAAWEEAVELEVQVIDPAYDDENTTVYYTEKLSPYTSSTESFSYRSPMKDYNCSDSSAEEAEIGPNDLQLPSFSTRTTSDELELEALSICTSMMVDIMAKAEETIIANEINKHRQTEANVAHAVNISQINNNDKYDEIRKDMLANKETPTELNKTQFSAPIINAIEHSRAETIYTETSEEEDLYDIESINVHSEDILKLNSQDISAVCNPQMNTQKVLSSGCQKGSMIDELETFEGIEEANTTKHAFKITREVTASNLSVQCLDISTEEPMVKIITAGHEICPADSEVEKPLSVKEKECYDTIVIKSKDNIVINPISLPVNNEYPKEHLESFTAPTSTSYKMGNRVQSCDDIFVRAAEESDSTDLLSNTSGRTEVPHKGSLRSLDSLSQVYYKNTETEDIKYQSGQRDKLAPSININKKPSPILNHKDSNENGVLINNKMTEDKPHVSSLTVDDQCRENENRSEALTVFEKKITVVDVSTLAVNDDTDLFASISTIIKNGFEPSEIAKSDEVLYKRTLSSQNLMETSSHSTQEDKQIYDRSEKYIEMPFRYSGEHRSVRRTPHDRSNKPHQMSERKTKTNNLQRPSSSRDGRDAKKKNDIDSNPYPRKRVTPGETPNGKVCKTWKLGSRIKKLISSIKRKL